MSYIGHTPSLSSSSSSSSVESEWWRDRVCEGEERESFSSSTLHKFLQSFYQLTPKSLRGKIFASILRLYMLLPLLSPQPHTHTYLHTSHRQNPAECIEWRVTGPMITGEGFLNPWCLLSPWFSCFIPDPALLLLKVTSYVEVLMPFLLLFPGICHIYKIDYADSLLIFCWICLHIFSKIDH